MDLQIPTSTLVGFSLALVRATAFIAICPPFNSPAVSVRVRVGLATGIALAIAGPLGASAAPDVLEIGPFLFALLTQALAGVAFGFCIYVLFAAVQGAGELIDLQIGFSLGAVLDPLSGVNAAPIGRFHQVLAVGILFAINGHVLVIRGFLRSVEAVPSGKIDFETFGTEIVGLLRTFMIAIVEIGLPVLAALFLTEVALGLIGKAAPQLNVLVIGFAAKTFVAIVLLALTVALLPTQMESLLMQSIRAGARVFSG